MPVAKLDNAPRCRHTKVNGSPCQAPALRGLHFCHFHLYAHSPRDYALPFVEDAYSLNLAVMQVLRALTAGALDRKTAATILYGLQIAASNLKRLHDEQQEVTTAATAVEEKSLAEILIDRLDADLARIDAYEAAHPDESLYDAPAPVPVRMEDLLSSLHPITQSTDQQTTRSPDGQIPSASSVSSALGVSQSAIGNFNDPMARSPDDQILEIHACADDHLITRSSDRQIASVPRRLGGGFSNHQSQIVNRQFQWAPCVAAP